MILAANVSAKTCNDTKLEYGVMWSSDEEKSN